MVVEALSDGRCFVECSLKVAHFVPVLVNVAAVEVERVTEDPNEREKENLFEAEVQHR